MQIRSPQLSGNQRLASSSSTENCRPLVTKGRGWGERRREKIISAFVEFPHLALEEAVHLVISFITISLSFFLFSPSLCYVFVHFKGASQRVETRSNSSS